MSMDYSINAEQILRILGYNKPEGEKFLNAFEHGRNIKLPLCLRNFYKLSFNCRLLSTADIWTTNMFFSYDEIKDEIEESEKDYWDNQEEEDSEYHRLLKILSETPEKQWPEYVANYLEIGSDYGAGVVRFGICINDMDKEDPPVYMLFEDSGLTGWELLCDTLSGYFMMVICDALLCTQYKTAGRVLQEAGWNFNLYESDEIEETAKTIGIDISIAEMQTLYGGKVVCSYDEERKMLIVAGIYEDNKYSFRACTISKDIKPE